MVLIEESIYRGDTLILIRKVNTFLRESKLKITLLRLKLPVNLTVCHVLKAREVIVKLNPHFSLLGTYFYCKIS